MAAGQQTKHITPKDTKMKNKMQLVIAAASLLAVSLIAGCNTYQPKGTVNASPLGAVASSLTGPNSGFNPGTMNLEALNLSLSQLQQFGTLDVTGTGVSVHLARNMPPGYVWQPTVPLTSNEVALVEADFLASAVYGLRNDHSSVDVVIVPAIGWTVTLHMAYPPSTLNTSVLITNVVTTPSTTFTNTLPSTTKTVVSQVISGQPALDTSSNPPVNNGPTVGGQPNSPR